MKNILSNKEFKIISEADASPFAATPAAPPAAPAPAATPPAPAAPAPQPSPAPEQKPPQAQQQKPQPQAQKKPQGKPQGKLGDLSDYNDPEVTEHPETVKNMVELIRSMDKGELVKLRDFLGNLKNMGEPKKEIGKL